MATGKKKKQYVNYSQLAKLGFASSSTTVGGLTPAQKQTLEKLASWFDEDDSGNIYVKPNGSTPRNFYSLGDVSGGGPGQRGGGGTSAIVIPLREEVTGIAVDLTEEEITALVGKITEESLVVFTEDMVGINAAVVIKDSSSVTVGASTMMYGFLVGITATLNVSGTATASMTASDLPAGGASIKIPVINNAIGWRVNLSQSKIVEIYNKLTASDSPTVFVQYNGLNMLAHYNYTPSSNTKNVLVQIAETEGGGSWTRVSFVIALHSDGTSSVQVISNVTYDEDIDIPLVNQGGTWVVDLSSAEQSAIRTKIINGRYRNVYVVYPFYGGLRTCANVAQSYARIMASFTHNETDGIRLVSVFFEVGAPSVDVKETILTPQ